LRRSDGAIRRTGGGLRGRLAGCVVLAAMVAGVAAAPAVSATSADTVWVPLACNIGTIPIHVGLALNATAPTAVSPGQQFELTSLSGTLDIPAAAQNSFSTAFGLSNQVEGVLTDLEVNLTGATAAFPNADTSLTGGGKGTWGPDLGTAAADPSSGTSSQVNLVAATQFPNALGSGTDPLVNGPSPIIGFPDFPETPLMGGWSFGPAGLDTPTAATLDAQAVVPGSGGGTGGSAGTPDPVAIGPLTTTGPPGLNVGIGIGNPGQVIPFIKSTMRYVATLDLFLFESQETGQGLGGQWSADVSVPCGLDTTAQAIPSPNPSYLSAATGIQMPIVANAVQGPPAVTGVSPTGSSPSGGTSLTVLGNGFAPGDNVTIGGAAATNEVFNGASSITVTAPAAASGIVDVQVTDPTLGPSILSAQDKYSIGVPSVDSLGPATGPAAGGTPVTVTGTGFASGETVSFGGVAATSVTVNSDTSLTAVAPSGTGTVDVTVKGTGRPSTTSLGDRYTYAGAPAVTSLSPKSGPSSGGTIVTVSGTGFRSGDTVSFGGTSATTVGFVSPTELIATAPAGGGTVDVTVTDPSGATSATGSGDRYTFATPTVTAVSPSGGPAGGGTTVTVTGTGFRSGDAVSFGTTAASGVTVNSTTSLTAVAPAGTGTVDILVTDPNGSRSAPTPSDSYTYVPAAPSFSVSPPSGPAAGGNTVTLNGSGFAAGDTVKFGSSAATNVNVVSSSQITVTAPPGAAGTTVDVSLNTPGGSFTGAADTYTYLAAPTVTGVSPSSGPATGGTMVTVTGSGFTSATLTVDFGSSPATNVSVASDGQLTATAPAGTGTVDVTVVSSTAGASPLSAADQFSYVVACSSTPTITQQPSPVAVTVGQTATFTAAASAPVGCSITAVQWQISTDGESTWFNVGGATGTTLSVTSTTLAQSGDLYRVVFVDGNGSTASNGAKLTVNPLANTPVVTGVTPSSGGAFSLVIITGQNLNGASQVTFGGRPTLFLGLGSRFVIALAPIGPSGTVDVQVRTRVATSATGTADHFTYTH
jgi:hypothetical protein